MKDLESGIIPYYESAETILNFIMVIAWIYFPSYHPTQ
jgi:hypothetical protein